jgi:hypothetical protein
VDGRQIARARTLSFALAAIGLIAAAPASAAEEVKTQVKVTSVLEQHGPAFFL